MFHYQPKTILHDCNKWNQDLEQQYGIKIYGKKATKQPQNKYHDCLIELFNCLLFEEYGISVFVWK